jgi:Flp pilus assembly protein TadG
MKAPAIRKPNRFQAQRAHLSAHPHDGERGVTMLLVAVAMVAIMAIAALSIDVITLFLAREEAQRAADAAALTAAKVISLSGITGDPANSSGYWSQICDGGTLATKAAQAVGSQNAVGGGGATVDVKYSVGGTPSSNCSSLGPQFAVNPIVTVKVTRNNLPTFFSRIWGSRGNSVSATATAEAFNPSNSGNVGIGPIGTITPVSPRCVKPWIVPNRDPLNASGCVGNTCQQLVVPATGDIVHKGISLGGTGSNGVIGEEFTLVPDCAAGGATCTLNARPPIANYTTGPPPAVPPNLQYVPGTVSTIPTGIPRCAATPYQQAIAGCDQSTNYQCGTLVASLPAGVNTVDLNENPAADTTAGVQCLINQAAPSATGPADGQDSLNPYGAPGAYPFQILAGTGNSLGAGLSGTPISVSSSIVSLPIYDDSIALAPTGSTQVPFVGFLQVFINGVDANGKIDVTVLNVAGCGNGTNSTATPVNGSSPVPVRLITPP